MTEFEHLVFQMRLCQRAYKRMSLRAQKNPNLPTYQRARVEILDRCMKWEKEVDEYLVNELNCLSLNH